MIPTNILEKNQTVLDKRFLEKTRYIDCDYRGFIDDDTMPSLARGDALINSVKVWLLSRGGDYYKNSEKGGIITILLNTPLTEDNISTIENAIEEKFSKTFSLLQLVSLTVIPIYEKRVWKLSFEIKDLLNNELISFGTSIKV
jgi:hypothetical protein